MREIFRGAFKSIEDESNGQGIRPVVFDIVAPDGQTSLLPDRLKLVLQVNPSNMSFSYSKNIQEMQTLGGFVEQHWGDQPPTISVSASTGGFKRLYAGVMGVASGGGQDIGGSRRETLAYDKYLDILALFHNNGAIYDSRNKIIFHGFIRMIFDSQSHLGWFNTFTVTETPDKPTFELSFDFQVSEETWMFRRWNYRRNS